MSDMIAATMREEVRKAAEMFDNSSSYEEFKMKMRLAGMSMYNIDILRAIRYRVVRKRSEYEKFKKDLLDNFDLIHPMDDVELMVARAFAEQSPRMKPYESLMVKTWIEKNEHRYRKSRYTKERRASGVGMERAHRRGIQEEQVREEPISHLLGGQ